MSRNNRLEELRNQDTTGITRSLTTHEMASLLGVTSSTIIQWIKNNKIKCTRTLGGHRRIPASELERIRTEMKIDKTDEQPVLSKTKSTKKISKNKSSKPKKKVEKKIKNNPSTIKKVEKEIEHKTALLAPGKYKI